MMWELKLKFVDDLECYKEYTNKVELIRCMCRVYLGQFNVR